MGYRGQGWTRDGFRWLGGGRSSRRAGTTLNGGGRDSMINETLRSTNDGQPRYAISNRIGTAASMPQRARVGRVACGVGLNEFPARTGRWP